MWERKSHETASKILWNEWNSNLSCRLIADSERKRLQAQMSAHGNVDNFFILIYRL